MGRTLGTALGRTIRMLTLATPAASVVGGQREAHFRAPGTSRLPTAWISSFGRERPKVMWGALAPRGAGHVTRQLETTVPRQSVLPCEVGHGQGSHQQQNALRVIEKIAEELAKLTHPIPHGLRVDEQLVGHQLAPTLVEQPRAQ